LRSRLPVSPLPWAWHRRFRRSLVPLIVLVVLGAAAAVVLLQRISSSDEEAATREPAPPQIERVLKGMPLKDRASGVLAAGFDDPSQAVAEVRRIRPGGIVVRPGAWPGAGEGTALLARLRGAAGGVPPLLIAEQEGGEGRTLTDLPPEQTEIEVAAALSPPVARSWARETSAAMKQVGFDLNLAPVADVAALVGPVGDRAFGDDPEIVTALTAAAVRGCAEGGIACAVSHFPGLGAASGDPADAPATVSLDEVTLETRDLPPFEAAFSAGVPAVVLSLAFYAAYDPVTPGALTPAVADGLLREELGFKGVAITDDLTSGAISAGIGAPEAAVQAVAAGADLVVISDPRQAAQAREALVAAARSGALPADRLDEAVARVLTLKKRLGLLDQS
jgi:beta-N-acetylhexosaminidase